MSVPTLYEAVPYPGVPRYFLRRWRATGDGLAERSLIRSINPDGTSNVTMAVGGDEGAELAIWGYSCRSTFPEDDAAVEDRAFAENGVFPSVCFSTVEPDGEFGFTPLSLAQPVERWELEAALAQLGVEWVDPERSLQHRAGPYGFGIRIVR